MNAERSIAEVIATSLERYFRDLDGQPASQVYEMVIHAVEKPLLEVVMREAQGNQLRASEMLGINRNTLRKKLLTHGLLEPARPGAGD
jgi:Fis family transcriptional regulator